MGGTDHLRFLVESSARQAVLDHLATTDTVTTTGLEATLDVSRRTITRALTAFETRGYAVSTPDGYRITAFGAYCHEQFTDAKAALTTADEVKPVVSRIDAAGFDIPLDAFASATVTEPTATNPYAPLERLVALRADATTVRMALHIISQQTITQLIERATTSAVQTEVLLSEHYVTNAGQSPTDADDRLDQLAAANGVSVCVVEQTVPYMVGIIDDTVTIGVREDRSARALLETDAEAAREWAREKLASLRAIATPYAP